MSPWARRKMAMQFLYAMNFLHKHGVCHRDLSYGNVLVHTYNEAFMVEVSDFGLAKERGSDLTSTGSSMKGSIIDPALKSFRDFKPVNDIYSIGFILNYILTGKENLVTDGSRRGSIIQKCSATNSADRYQTVRDIIEDMKRRNAPSDENGPRRKEVIKIRRGFSTCRAAHAVRAVGPGGRVMDHAKGLGPLYQARRRMNRRGLGSPPCQTPPDMPWPFCSEMPISSNWAGLYLSMNVMGTPMTPQ